MPVFVCVCVNTRQSRITFCLYMDDYLWSVRAAVALPNEAFQMWTWNVMTKTERKNEYE